MLPIPLNNIATTLQSAHAAGSGTIAVAAGYGATIAAAVAASGRVLGPADPVRLTLLDVADLDASGALLPSADPVMLDFSALAGDVLSGGTWAEGAADRDLAAGSYVFGFWTAGQIRAIHEAIGTGGETDPYGLVYDGTTDQSSPLQAALDAAGVTAPLVVRPVATPSGALYLNATVSIRNDGTVLDLSSCPLVYGPQARLIVRGELDELPASGKPKLRSAVTAGATVLPVQAGTGTFVPVVGDKLVIRGTNDATGNTTTKENAYVSAVVDNGGGSYDLTLSAPLANAYQVDNPGSPWASSPANDIPGHDYTYITRTNGALATGDVAEGSMVMAVAAVGGLVAGDYVMVGDARLTSTGNSVHNEVNRIVGISGTTLTFASPLFHAIEAAQKAGVTAVRPVVGFVIRGARITYGAADGGSGSQYPLACQYAVGGLIEDCQVTYSTVGGVNYGAYAMGCRVEFSLDVTVRGCRHEVKPDPEIYGSGKGYGFVLHGATLCRLLGNTSVNCRHGVLLQFGAAGNEVANHTDIGSRISGIDFHGINARRNHVHDCTIVGGPLSTPDASTHRAIKIGNTSHFHGDHHNLVEDVVVYSYGYSGSGDGLEILPPSSDNVIRSVEVRDADHGLRIASNAGASGGVAARNRVEGCTFLRCVDGVLDVDGDAGFLAAADLALVRNVSVENDIHFELSNVQGALLDGNAVVRPVADSGRHAVFANNVTGLRVVRNNLGGSNRGVKIRACPEALVLDNDLTNLAESVVFTDDTSAGNNNGYIFGFNDVSGTAAPSYVLGSSTGGAIYPRRSVRAQTTIDAATLPLWISTALTYSPGTSALVTTPGGLVASASFTAAAGSRVKVRGTIPAVAIDTTAPVVTYTGTVTGGALQTGTGKVSVSGGQSYSVAPTVAITGGSGATGTAVLGSDGAVTDINITGAGSGFSGGSVVVTLSGGTGIVAQTPVYGFLFRASTCIGSAVIRIATTGTGNALTLVVDGEYTAAGGVEAITLRAAATTATSLTILQRAGFKPRLEFVEFPAV